MQVVRASVLLVARRVLPEQRCGVGWTLGPAPLPPAAVGGRPVRPAPWLGSVTGHNISLFLLQAMGLVRAIPLRLRKGTTVFPRQGNRQIHGL